MRPMIDHTNTDSKTVHNLNLLQICVKFITIPTILSSSEQGIDISESTPFWLFAYEYGYSDEWTQQFTQYGYSYYDWKWYDAEGNLVANTDDMFYKQVYGEIVKDYNEEYELNLNVEEWVRSSV